MTFVPSPHSEQTLNWIGGAFRKDRCWLNKCLADNYLTCMVSLSLVDFLSAHKMNSKVHIGHGDSFLPDPSHIQVAEGVLTSFAYRAVREDSFCNQLSYSQTQYCEEEGVNGTHTHFWSHLHNVSWLHYRYLLGYFEKGILMDTTAGNHRKQ